MSSVSAQWIEDSLSQLERLEAERSHHEAALENTSDATELRMHTEALEDLDAEIRGLYTALEAVAEQEEEDDSANSTTGYATEDEPANSTSGYEPPQLGDYDPFGPPPGVVASTSPIREAVAGAPLSAFPDSGIGSSFTAHDVGGGGGVKWAAIGAVVLAVAVGGFMAMSGNDAAAPAAQTGPATVINSGPIPEDTQGPNAAVGADVDSTPGTQFKKSRRSGGGGKARGGDGGGSSRRGNPEGVGKDGKISIKKTKDPLGGL